MRDCIEMLSGRFVVIDERSRSLLAAVEDDKLFSPVAANSLFPSPGVCLLRSAAVVEQTFLGLTRRLWDDPFEWTLPEKLSDKASINQYLDEVAEARTAGLAFLQDDADLARRMPAPEKLTRIGDLLIDTIAAAEHYLGRSAALIEIACGTKLPRV